MTCKIYYLRRTDVGLFALLIFERCHLFRSLHVRHRHGLSCCVSCMHGLNLESQLTFQVLQVFSGLSPQMFKGSKSRSDTGKRMTMIDYAKDCKDRFSAPAQKRVSKYTMQGDLALNSARDDLYCMGYDLFGAFICMVEAFCEDFDLFALFSLRLS